MPAHPATEFLSRVPRVEVGSRVNDGMTMKNLLRAARSRKVVLNALRVSLVVGSILNLINQGGALLSGSGVSWAHILLNYVVPFCVSSYSAAKNEVG